jgi:hypothetical protein
MYMLKIENMGMECSTLLYMCRVMRRRGSIGLADQ